jgi:hypothetical protein
MDPVSKSPKRPLYTKQPFHADKQIIPTSVGFFLASCATIGVTYFTFYMGRIVGASYVCGRGPNGVECSIPGLEPMIQEGTNFILAAMWSFGLTLLPYLLVGGVSLLCFSYWIAHLMSWKKKGFIMNTFAVLGLLLTIFSVLVLFVGPTFGGAFFEKNSAELLKKHIDKTTSASENHFICVGDVALVLEPDGSLYRYSLNMGYGTTYFGIANNESKIFTWNYSGQGNSHIDAQKTYLEYSNLLKSCKNKDGKSVFDLYQEEDAPVFGDTKSNSTIAEYQSKLGGSQAIYKKNSLGILCHNKVIPDVDANTFNYIGYYYAKDKNHVYLCRSGSGNPVVYAMEADPDTFQALSEIFTKDATNVYYLNTVSSTITVMSSAHTPSFTVYESNQRYAKDKYHVYEVGIVEGADPETFIPPER